MSISVNQCQSVSISVNQSDYQWVLSRAHAQLSGTARLPVQMTRSEVVVAQVGRKCLRRRAKVRILKLAL